MDCLTTQEPFFYNKVELDSHGCPAARPVLGLRQLNHRACGWSFGEVLIIIYDGAPLLWKGERQVGYSKVSP